MDNSQRYSILRDFLQKTGLLLPTDNWVDLWSIYTQAISKAKEALHQEDLTEQEVIWYWTGKL